MIKGIVGVTLAAGTLSIGSRYWMKYANAESYTSATFECMTQAGHDLLQTDKDLYHHLLTLKTYRTVDPSVFDNIIIHIVQLIHLHDVTSGGNKCAPFYLAVQSQEAFDDIVKQLKTLKMQIQKSFTNDTKVLEDYNEVFDLLVPIIDTYRLNTQMNVRNK